jgi:membrane protease YdiL (CAAX protease family)
MKSSQTIRFIVFTFVFSWLCWSIAIFNGQPSTTSPNIVLFTLGGSGPTLIALVFVLRSFNAEKRRDFWSRVIDPRRIRPTWWLITLLAIPVVVVLGVVLDILLGGALPAMPNLKLLMADPISIPIFLIMMLIAGPLSEELGWRGLVLETFQLTWSPLRSTLTLATVWWIWHLPLFFMRGTTHYSWGLFTPMFWLFMIQVLLLTTLMTLAYRINRRSVMAAILIHFSYNLMISLLIPVSTAAFAFATVFLASLVIVVSKVFGWKETANVESSGTKPRIGQMTKA